MAEIACNADGTTHYLTTQSGKRTFRQVEILVFTGYTLQG